MTDERNAEWARIRREIGFDNVSVRDALAALDQLREAETKRADAYRTALETVRGRIYQKVGAIIADTLKAAPAEPLNAVSEQILDAILEEEP
jgi:hypothetical protein